MDAERIAELKAWARRLESRDDNEELRAAGKAIALLVAEVEDLQGRLTAAEAGAPPPPPEPAPTHEDDPMADLGPRDEESAEDTLRERLKRTLGFH